MVEDTGLSSTQFVHMRMVCAPLPHRCGRGGVAVNAPAGCHAGRAHGGEWRGNGYENGAAGAWMLMVLVADASCVFANGIYKLTNLSTERLRRLGDLERCLERRCDKSCSVVT